MKLYLAGPMRGIPSYNFPAFMAAAQRLRAMGHEVWNPAEHDVREDGFDPDKDFARAFIEYMRRHLPAVLASEAVAMLPGWRKSKGARLEAHVAQECGLPLLNAWDLSQIKETVLEEAERITGGDRNNAYGHPVQDFTAIACMWGSYLSKLLNHTVTIEPIVVPHLMILLKVAREAKLPQRDNLVDIAGYARCAERLEEAT